MKVQLKVIHVPDTRGVTLSPYGHGNMKIGENVYTYSRLPGRPYRQALGYGDAEPTQEPNPQHQLNRIPYGGTCPGSTPECEAICYAERPVRENNIVEAMWLGNSGSSDVPPIPEDCKLLRLHVSGDFDTVKYIENWIKRLRERPDVRCWGYTRSWRVPELRYALEALRALPNVQLFASMDASCQDLPPVVCKACHLDKSNPQHLVGCPDDAGAHDFQPWPWRRSWIHRSWDQAIKSGLPMEDRLVPHVLFVDDTSTLNPEAGYYMKTSDRNMIVWNDQDPLAVDQGYTSAFVCPEETGHKPDCEACRYCFDGKKNDVVFLEH